MPRGDNGPRADVGRLYDRYGAALYRYALMILTEPAGAEDAVQQVFTALLTPGRGDLDDEERYLRRAVRNECYSSLRRRMRTVAERPLLEAVGPEPRPDERLALEAAMRGLPPEQREVLHLHVFEGRTFQEIADVTQESINTISSRYRYAIAKLRQVLIP
jgi:RNA polymerase sigma factor (sigma-70 family)